VAGEEVEMRPAIVAPVSRSLAVADAVRSAAFYRDVLGFEIHQGPDGTEATCGPALLHFGARGPGRAIVFFETDDIDAMHSDIRARGGPTSEIVKVNWIKMRMFEIRDPDGNSEVAVTLKGWLEEFVTVTVCDGGFAPPCCPENISPVGSTVAPRTLLPAARIFSTTTVVCTAELDAPPAANWTVPFELAVAGAVDLTHPTSTDGRQDFVRAEFVAR
jgi:predicted enzyme related to lactoylglutathione lyase